MSQGNNATIEPLTETDLETAADGHAVDVDELRNAVATIRDTLDAGQVGDEIAEQQIPDGHGEFTEPTVIWQDDDYVCIYVTHGVLQSHAKEHPHLDLDHETACAVAWAHNAHARWCGASPDGLGAMDAVVLPRTDRVNQIIEERA